MLKNIDEIAEFLNESQNSQEVRNFLHAILTPAEIQSLAARWEIVKLLDQGMTQRKIAKKLHVSLCKITRGSKELKKDNSIIKKALHFKTTKSLSKED